MSSERIVRVRQPAPVNPEQAFPPVESTAGAITLAPMGAKQKETVILHPSSGSAKMRKRDGTWRY
jgi:hypothetical protein